MSNMELREFHTFLEGLIERTSEEQRFSVDKVVGTILSRLIPTISQVVVDHHHHHEASVSSTIRLAWTYGRRDCVIVWP